MKNLTITLLLIISFCGIANSQLVEPRLKNNRFVYKKDTLSKLEAYEEFDAQFVKEIQLSDYSKGFWKAKLTNITGEIRYLLAAESNFISNDRYVTELKKYTKDSKLVGNNSLTDLQKKYGSKIGRGIYYETPIIGMTSKMVIWCIGTPKKINSTETRSAYSSQWVYPGYSKSSYYYFTNGKLTAIQD